MKPPFPSQRISSLSVEGNILPAFERVKLFVHARHQCLGFMKIYLQGFGSLYCTQFVLYFIFLNTALFLIYSYTATVNIRKCYTLYARFGLEQ
jgi:hypothetical protein